MGSTLNHELSIDNASEIEQIVSILVMFIMLMVNLFHYPIMLVSQFETTSAVQSTKSGKPPTNSMERRPTQMSSELHELASNTAGTNSVYTREATRTFTPSSAPSSMGQMIDCLRNKESYNQFLQHLISEYNDENLRFITELIQIKYEYQESEDNLVQHITSNLPSSDSPRGEYVALSFNDKGSDDDDEDEGIIGRTDCDPSPEDSPSTQTIEMMESSFLFFKDQSHRITPCLAPLDDEKSFHDSFVNEGETPSPPLSPVTLPELMMSHMTIPSIAPQSLSKLMMRSVDSEHGMGMDQVMTSYVFNGVGCNQEMLTISIPADIEKTQVMTQNEGDFMAQCVALYYEYIRDGAQNEINIPYATRQDIARQIEGGEIENEADLFWIFDASCVLIMRLLMASFQRFRHKNNNEKMYSSPTLTSTPNPNSHRKESMYHRVMAKYTM